MKPYSPADWFWAVGDGPPGQVYASRRFTYVTSSDPELLAFLAGGDLPTQIAFESELRDLLELADVPFLALPLRPLEVARPRVHRARVRLLRAGQSLPSGAGAAVQWASGFDPLAMNNPGGPNPDRVVIPARQDGVYLAIGSASWAANATGDRAVQIRVGAQARRTTRARASASDTTDLQVVRFLALSAGDVVRLAVAQDSGGPLSVDAELELVRVE